MMTLMELQRRMAAAVMSPLTGSGDIASRTTAGRPMRVEAAVLIKPNGRLTSQQRLEIYNRQYWYRVLDSLYDDFPGLCAILGADAFRRLCKVYLTDCPSQSFTLRNLGSSLESWVRDHPEFGANNLPLALDMIRLEWAHIEAFDNPGVKPLGPDGLREFGPDLRLALQPYITLLELRYPVDDLRIRVNAGSQEHGTASNAKGKDTRRGLLRRFGIVESEPISLAVHRLGFLVYYRRLEAGELHLLGEIRRGRPIAAAIESTLERFTTKLADARAIQGTIEGWFSTWAKLGWLCEYPESEPKGQGEYDRSDKAA